MISRSKIRNKSCYTVESAEEILKGTCMAIQMKTTEQYFPVGVFIMFYKVILTFDPKV